MHAGCIVYSFQRAGKGADFGPFSILCMAQSGWLFAKRFGQPEYALRIEALGPFFR